MAHTSLRHRHEGQAAPDRSSGERAAEQDGRPGAECVCVCRWGGERAAGEGRINGVGPLQGCCRARSSLSSLRLCWLLLLLLQQGDRLKEAQNINRSLSALGDVIQVRLG